MSSRKFTEQIQLLQVAQPSLAVVKIYCRVIAGLYWQIARAQLIELMLLYL